MVIKRKVVTKVCLHRSTRVVSELYPISLLMHHIHPQHVLQYPLDPLCLSICMQMISCTKGQLCSQTYKQLILELGSEFHIPIWHDLLRNTIKSDHILMNTCATSLAENVDFTGMECEAFFNLSTITMNKSCCLTVLDKHVMKFM